MKEIQAFDFCKETIEVKNRIEKGYMELCARLYRIKNERLYEGHFTEWELFLEELHILPSVASRMIKIYEVFVIEQKISPAKIEKAGGWSVVAELLPVAVNKEASEDLLEMAQTLTRRDLRIHVQTLKIAPRSEVDCKHRDTYFLRICRDCGEKWTEHGTA